MLKTRQEPDNREKSEDSQFEKKPNIDSKIFFLVCKICHGEDKARL